MHKHIIHNRWLQLLLGLVMAAFIAIAGPTTSILADDIEEIARSQSQSGPAVAAAASNPELWVAHHYHRSDGRYQARLHIENDGNPNYTVHFRSWITEGSENGPFVAVPGGSTMQDGNPGFENTLQATGSEVKLTEQIKWPKGIIVGNWMHLTWEVNGQPMPPVHHRIAEQGQVRLGFVRTNNCTIAIRYIIDPWLVVTIAGVDQPAEQLKQTEGRSMDYALPANLANVDVTARVYRDKELTELIGEASTNVDNGCYQAPKNSLTIGAKCPTPNQASNDLTVAGALTDDKGAPVANASIKLTLPTADNTTVEVTVATNAKGEYSYLFQNARSFIGRQIKAEADNTDAKTIDIVEAMFTACVNPPQGENSLTIGAKCPTPNQASNDLTVAGALTDDKGAPVANASIKLTLPAADNTTVEVTVATNAKGEYSYLFQNARSFIGRQIKAEADNTDAKTIDIVEAIFTACVNPPKEAKPDMNLEISKTCYYTIIKLINVTDGREPFIEIPQFGIAQYKLNYGDVIRVPRWATEGGFDIKVGLIYDSDAVTPGSQDKIWTTTRGVRGYTPEELQSCQKWSVDCNILTVKMQPPDPTKGDDLATIEHYLWGSTGTAVIFRGNFALGADSGSFKNAPLAWGGYDGNGWPQWHSINNEHLNGPGLYRLMGGEIGVRADSPWQSFKLREAEDNLVPVCAPPNDEPKIDTVTICVGWDVPNNRRIEETYELPRQAAEYERRRAEIGNEADVCRPPDAEGDVIRGPVTGQLVINGVSIDIVDIQQGETYGRWQAGNRTWNKAAQSLHGTGYGQLLESLKVGDTYTKHGKVYQVTSNYVTQEIVHPDDLQSDNTLLSCEDPINGMPVNGTRVVTSVLVG